MYKPPPKHEFAEGWGAVLFPGERRYRTFPIGPPHPGLQRRIERQMDIVMREPVVGMERAGILSAAVADVAAKDTTDEQVSVYASMLSREIEHPFWYVEATREDGGTHTSVTRLEARSAEEAEKAFLDTDVVRMMRMAADFADAVRAMRRP